MAYQQSLSSLLDALNNGLAGSQAQSLLSDILDQRAQAQAARQQEMSQVTDAILGQAQGGASFGSVDTMLNALKASGQLGPGQMRRARDVAGQAYGLGPGDQRMGYYQPGGGGYGNLSQMIDPQVAAQMQGEPDFDAATAQVLPEVSALVNQAFKNGRSPAEVKQAILTDPDLSLLYVKNPSLFDDMIEQAQLSAASG